MTKNGYRTTVVGFDADSNKSKFLKGNVPLVIL